MAQAAMGPPLSPRETRRSGRRSAPSTSTSTSKSPDSDQPPRQKDGVPRPAPTSTGNGGRTKRLKQEDLEENVDDRRNSSSTSTPASTSFASNPTAVPGGKSKRKVKEKDKQLAIDEHGDPPSASAEDHPPDAVEEEEQGITRCVCGSSGEDDPDAGEFMVQCETCKVWQHGLCMGYQSEDQVHDYDYYCEQCRPELHVDLIKKLSKRPRQTSAGSHHNPVPSTSRVSRSHSPSHSLKQPSKRRNTMNSRDAAFDESLKEIIEATAAEAAAHGTVISAVPSVDVSPTQEVEEETEAQQIAKRKRKRSEDDVVPKKRTRSASSASDRASIIPQDDASPLAILEKSLAPVAPQPPPKSSGRNKRGGRKNANVDTVASVDGDEVPTAPKRTNNSSRSKGSTTAKRPPFSHVGSHGSGNDHSARRNQSGGVAGQAIAPVNTESSRAYRSSHAYAVSQQSLFTSWNLPDYLAHLEEMLPTDTPQPLEVRAGPGVAAGGRGESTEWTMERGVKVKWPSKRMSVGDMNKRVRALVEWVGREQASALDRGRRRIALERALYELASDPGETEATNFSTGNVEPSLACSMEADSRQGHSYHLIHDTKHPLPSTMKTMEELMEELIGFQERFGPGAKNRERERRMLVGAS